MDVIDRVRKALEDSPNSSIKQEELSRLEDFLKQMKAAGVAKTREYDLPLPDTLGRAFVEPSHRQEPR